ncbi:DUF2065 domain-containing protein [Coralliovum pocilloporae]|uniref:DUF2065 domain-containing protein n=1 Tax=Coralliovum pocilloporae TaxID=3066369 RepID=UPI0033074F8C
MNDLIVALGLVFVIEGALYALMPSRMKSILVQMIPMPDHVLRRAGLAAAFFGTLLVWLVRG